MRVKPAKKRGRVIVELEAKDESLLEKSEPSAPLRIQSILAPLDFSESSLKAVRYASALARQFGAQVHLLHVLHISYTFSEFGVAPAVDFPLLEKEMAANAKRQLNELGEREVGEAHLGKVLVTAGRPVTEIAEQAGRLGVDLIVISTHGHTGLKHVLLGSIAENVVRHAPCPVLVVRQRERDFLREK